MNIKKKTTCLLLATSFFMSCSHQQKLSNYQHLPIPSSQRDPAAVDYQVPLTNPVSGKTYWQEYTEIMSMKGPKFFSPYLKNRVDQVDEIVLNMILPGTKKTKEIIVAERRFAEFKPELFHFLMWMRSNPISTFKGMRNNSQNSALPKGIFKFSSLTDKISGGKYKVGDTFVITKMDDVLEILEQPKKFSVRNYRDKMLDSVGTFMLSYDEENINLQEKPWMRSMLPASDLPKVRNLVRKISSETIKDQRYIGTSLDNKEFGRLEVVNQYARRVPIIFTQEYFGIKGNDIKDLYFWSRATQDDFFHNLPNDPEVRSLSSMAGKQMDEYLKSYIVTRKQQLQKELSAKGLSIDKSSAEYNQFVSEQDILSRLILDKNFTNDVNTNERIRTNVMGTLVGGIETTQAAVVQAFDEIYKRKAWFDYAVRVAEHHEAALESGDDEAAKKDIQIIESLIWEALRFKPVNPIVVRYTEEDYTLKGVKIPKGSILLVSTQSAMFDEDYFKDAEVFNPQRTESAELAKLKNLRNYFEEKQDHFNKSEYHQGSSKWDKFKTSYFHLGYGHHRCLGDYIGEIHVPEMVTQLLKLPKIKPVEGQAGKLDFRSLRSTSGFGDKYYFSFPEHYELEFSTTSPFKNISESLKKKNLEIPNPDYLFEEYLTDHDRDTYRQCLAGWDLDVKSEDIQKNLDGTKIDILKRALFSKNPKDHLLGTYISRASKTHDYNADMANKDYLFCRMPKSYLSCFADESAKGNFHQLEKNIASPDNILDFSGFDKHLAVYQKCSQSANLSSTQKEFYENIFFGKKLDLAKVSTEHIKPAPAGYEFENTLKFYNRFNSRESLLNFLGWLKIPDSKTALMYTRLDLGFRLCYGSKVNSIFNKQTKAKAYFDCKDGVYFPKQFEWYGALSKTEKYFMLKHYLGEGEDLKFLSEIKSIDDIPAFEQRLRPFISK
ncbi:MAG: cytochrome P450 [Bdellovibrionaceae bacterium]|nr:cytochrome P450 [Pseudobdellovibrionaceae bacterium]